MNPFSYVSDMRESRLIHFDGDGNGAAAVVPPNGDGEPDASTPAGKKWAQLREEKKAAQEALRQEREARIAAEAKASAFEEFKAQFAPPTKKVEQPIEGDEIQVNPEDAKVVSTVMMRELKRMGLDKVPEVLTQLQQNTQTIQATSALERARQELEAEFAGSVPFNYQETLKYAQERGYGLTFTNAKDALRMAHKEKNEEAFIAFWKGGPKPKKVVPQMVASGIEDDEDIAPAMQTPIDPKSINSLDDARSLAKKMFESESEV